MSACLGWNCVHTRRWKSFRNTDRITWALIEAEIVFIYYECFCHQYSGDILSLLRPLLYFYLHLCFFALLSSACHNMHPKGHQRMTNYFSAISNQEHGVLTFRTQVMSPPHPKINCSLILRHPRARIRWNLKDSSREMGLFKKTRSKWSIDAIKTDTIQKPKSWS